MRAVIDKLLVFSRLRAAACVSLALAACGRDAPPAGERAAERVATAEPSPAPPGPARSRKPPRIVEVPPGGEPVADVVRRERTAAEAEGGRLLVVVGAAWCEPCRRFHQAIQDGKLDAVFPGLVLLELDLDRDGGRLAADGYASRLIPLIIVPEANGRASRDPARRLEGSIKGDGAVDEMVPRLRRVLEAP